MIGLVCFSKCLLSMTILGQVRTRRKQRPESWFKAYEVAGLDPKPRQTEFRILAAGLLWDGTEDESNAQCMHSQGLVN